MKDRIKKFLIKNLEQFYFNELSQNFLEKNGFEQLMNGIPVPIHCEIYENLGNGKELQMKDIVKGMLFVLGCDADFVYCEHYKGFLFKLFGENLLKMTLADAGTAAEKGNFIEACVGYRASLSLKPENLEALQGYARVCREIYLNGEEEDEAFVGSFKAESLERFEYITMLYPQFPDAYYYLGYGYVNLGLYTKAKAAWEKYMELSENQMNSEDCKKSVYAEDRKEIEERLKQLKDPVLIEHACNDILSGRHQSGIEKLLPFTKVASYEKWWPMWHYLGIGYNQTGEIHRAVQCLKKVLTINPQNIQTMEILAGIYEGLGDIDNAEKYSKKILLIKKQNDINAQ